MKKATFEHKLICSLFCIFLAAMLVLLAVLPKQSFSELEKRQLEEAPVLTWENLTSGKFGADVETYMADHMPGRNFFVGLNAYFELLTGRQNTKDIYVLGDRLVNAPLTWDEKQVQKNIKYIQKFADSIGMNMDLILVPTAGALLEGLPGEYRDRDMIDAIYDLLESNVRCMDLTGLYRNQPDPGQLYYRTDHHWTSLGAYLATTGYMQCLGREYPQREDFTVRTVEGFRGSIYSRSGLWLTPAEPIELWSTGAQITVQNTDDPDQLHQGVFYENRLEEADKYTVFLDGNHTLVRVKNEANAGKGKILVIRDSYANCMGAFLAESYEEVVLVDLRYYKAPISQLVQQERFDNVLMCYSLENFMTDQNFPMLR